MTRRASSRAARGSADRGACADSRSAASPRWQCHPSHRPSKSMSRCNSRHESNVRFCRAASACDSRLPMSDPHWSWRHVHQRRFLFLSRKKSMKEQSFSGNSILFNFSRREIISSRPVVLNWQLGQKASTFVTAVTPHLHFPFLPREKIRNFSFGSCAQSWITKRRKSKEQEQRQNMENKDRKKKEKKVLTNKIFR